MRTAFFNGNGYIISWAAGHLLELAAPEFYGEKFKKWRYADLPIIPENMEEMSIPKLLREFLQYIV